MLKYSRLCEYIVRLLLSNLSFCKYTSIEVVNCIDNSDVDSIYFNNYYLKLDETFYNNKIYTTRNVSDMTFMNLQFNLTSNNLII